MPRVFFRDLLIKYSESSLIIIKFATKESEGHIELLAEVLQCISANGLELKLSKCHVAYPTIDYLG